MSTSLPDDDLFDSAPESSNQDGLIPETPFEAELCDGFELAAPPGQPPGFGSSYPPGFASGSPWPTPGSPPHGFPPSNQPVHHPGYPPPSSNLSADTDSFAWLVFVLRAVFVIMAGVLLILMCLVGWHMIATHSKDTVVADWSAQEGDQAAAKVALDQVTAKLAEQKLRIQETQLLRAKLFDELTETAKPGTRLETALNVIASSPADRVSERCQELRGLSKSPHDHERVRVWLIGAMQSSQFDVGAMRHVVNELGDDAIRAEFRKSIASAAEVRRRYKVSSSSMRNLIDATPLAERPELVGLVLEMWDQGRPDEELLASARVNWAEHAHLAFHPSWQVHSYVRGRLSPEECAAAALDALQGDPPMAIAAAEWWLQQTPDDARRDRVLAALEPCLAYSADDRYPAAAAYARWSDKSRIARLVELLSSPARLSVAADTCRTLANQRDERLEAIVKDNLTDVPWNQSLAPAIKDNNGVAAVLVKVLTGAMPDTNHRDLLTAWGERPGQEDATWLRDYAEKLPARQRTNSQSYYSHLQTIIRRKTGESQ